MIADHDRQARLRAAPPRQPSVDRARRREADAEQQHRERQQHVDRCARCTVSTQPRKKPRDHAHRHADRSPTAPVPTNATSSDTRAPSSDAREDVAAELVDAEEVLAARARSAVPKSSSALGRLLVRRRRADELADQRREDRDEDQQHDEGQRGERDLVLAKAAPEELQRRARGDWRLAGDDLDRRRGPRRAADRWRLFRYSNSLAPSRWVVPAPVFPEPVNNLHLAHHHAR